jgi:YVTN family beta-propeller protein
VGTPYGIAVNATTDTIYVTNLNAATVAVINGATNAVTATVSVRFASFGVAVDPTTNTIYTPNQDGSTGVWVIDGATNTVTTTVPVGCGPLGVAVDVATDTVYATNDCSGTVSVIDGSTNVVTATIPVGAGPRGVATDDTTNTIYVANISSDTVSVIDGATNAVTATVAVGNSPISVAVDATTHLIYVANSVSNTVSVLDTAASTVLIGDANVEATVDGLVIGTARAYPYVATSSGTLGHLSVYLDGTNLAGRFHVGLYADSGTGHPGTLLTSGKVNSAVAGQWNTVQVAPASIVAGQTYWIALLSRGQTMRIRDTQHGGAAELSQSTTLTSMPATWTTGSTFNRAPASAYGSP